ncbi:MAG: hypothetical protein EXS01_03640 [Phycisphaerales bacterium]|nr:hypothetical protein [Phycisphaerales bacterium]
MTRRRTDWTIAIALLGFVVAVAWSVGRVLTDRFAAIQYLHWIPTIAALVFTVLCALALRRSTWTRCRRALWTVALVQVGVFLLQDYRVLPPSRVDAGAAGPVIRVAHFNANWPGQKAQALGAALRDYFASPRGEGSCDVFFVSEAGALLSDQYAGSFCGPDTRGIGIGRFGIVSRVPIVEATLVFDDLKSTAALVRFAPWGGNPAWAALLVDLPSDPSASRRETLLRLKEILGARSIPEVDVIVGDFNTTRGAASLVAFAPTMRHAFTQAGIGLGATFPRALPLWHIDHILLAPNTTALRYAVVNLGVGKHCMQTATIRIARTE